MINVDMYVPAMHQTYNFNLDEASTISQLIDEIVELICKKEHSRLDGQKELFIMGSVDREIKFKPSFSLSNYSVKNGETLILV